MGHGPIKRVSSVINKLVPGNIIYPLNSQDQLVVVFIADNAVVVNTGEVFLDHRPIRYCGEWTHEFLIDWDSLKNYASSFKPEEFQSGMMVLWITEDFRFARVEILTSDEENLASWMTDDFVLIPYSALDRIVPTGLVFDCEMGEERFSDDGEELPE